jgi:hypothetical protein
MNPIRNSRQTLTHLLIRASNVVLFSVLSTSMLSWGAELQYECGKDPQFRPVSDFANLEIYNQQVEEYYDCIKTTLMYRQNPEFRALEEKTYRESLEVGQSQYASQPEQPSNSVASQGPSSPTTNRSGAAPGMRGGSTSSSGFCKSNLGYLGSQLPYYTDPVLIEYRNVILTTDLNEIMKSARSQGFTPQLAASASLQQSELAKGVLSDAERCIRQIATNPESVLTRLKNGTFRFGESSITSSCAQAYVGAYYNMIANRETAVGMACLANQ